MFLLVTTIEDRDFMILHGYPETHCWNNGYDVPVWRFYIENQQEVEKILSIGLQGDYGIVDTLAF